MRLLHKRPADRPQTADEVLVALESIGTPAEGTGTVPVRREMARRGRWLAVGGVVAAVLALSLAFLGGRRPRPPVTDGRVVAIAPFRVGGADSSLRYLREGMVDLLAAKLGGTTSLRPADPRTLLLAWAKAAGGAGDLPEQDAVVVAGAVGAGRLVQGEVVGAGGRLTMSARIIDVPGGTTRVRATAEGSADSVTRLVDRLAASLLALGAGEEEQRLAMLTSTSLPALRAYLDGEALLRRGVFLEAKRKFLDALALDTTFALAALGAVRASEWFGSGEEGAAAAWRHRDRLSRRDSARLEATLGPRYPALSSMGEQIGAAERFVELAPDSPDAWYKLGDLLFHVGALAGVPDVYRRVSAAFDRSLALDSSYAPAVEHLSEVAAVLGDTAGARRGLELHLRFDSLSPNAVLRRWHVAAYLGDTSGIRSALANDSLATDDFAPRAVVFLALDAPLDLRGTEAIYSRAHARSATAAERADVEEIWSRYEVMRGRPSRAPLLSGAEPVRQWIFITDALFADGDPARGRAAAAALEKELGRPLPAADPEQVPARYAVGQYALAGERFELVRRAIADLRNPRVPPDSAWQVVITRPFALVLEAQLAAALRQPAADDLLRSLDSALADPIGVSWTSFGNLVAARLHEERGELPAALAALRRRYVGIATWPHYVTFLRHEGRLAALTSDRKGAIQAYRHYLALRGEAEPALQPQVREVRAELEALERQVTDR
jgi:serine/threonine-protein kinase